MSSSTFIRRSSCAHPQTSEFSYQLFTVTSSIHGCVLGWRCSNQSESLLSLPVISGAAMVQTLAGLPGANKEKSFSNQETDLQAWLVKVQEHVMSWQGAFKAVKKKGNKTHQEHNEQQRRRTKSNVRGDSLSTKQHYNLFGTLDVM